MDRKEEEVLEPIRLHGFERPFHPLQVASWVVFGSDVICFCMFAIPLIRTAAMQLAVSTCFAISVGILVLACVKATGKDPADPHVRLQDSDVQLKNEDAEQLPFCTTCGTHVFTSSKHCRACNKCISTFDHHRHWLNTCIGQRNYRAFAVCISSVAVMTGIVIATCVYLFLEYFKDEEALVLRLEEGTLCPGMPAEAAFGILIAICIVNVPLFALDMQLVILHAFLASQNLTTFEYIMNKCNDECELDEMDQSSGATVLKEPKSSDPVPDANAPAKERVERRGWRRLKGMKKLPHCMDWIVFARCGRSRRRQQKNKIEQIGIEADKASTPSAEVSTAPNFRGHGHDRSVEHTPTPPGSTVDPLGEPEPLNIDSISDISALESGGAAASHAGAAVAASSSKDDEIGTSLREAEEIAASASSVRSGSKEVGETTLSSRGQTGDSPGVATCLVRVSVSDISESGGQTGNTPVSSSV